MSGFERTLAEVVVRSRVLNKRVVICEKEGLIRLCFGGLHQLPTHLWTPSERAKQLPRKPSSRESNENVT